MTAPAVVTYADAVKAAGRLKAAADAARDHLAATQGTRAVAEAAYVPGGPSVAELEAAYTRLRDASQRERAA